MPIFNILSAYCPHCRAFPGTDCVTRDGAPARKPHKARARDALALAAHADPALDEHFALGSPTCGVCGTPGLAQRHRVVDAIAGSLSAGEDEDVAAKEYGCSREAVDVVSDWMHKWPGAWL